jgi:uncharacterized protein (TIGR00299 family) protein
MKTLYLDIFSGISGDMFIGALIDLGVDFHQLEVELAKLRLDGYHLHVARKTKSSIDGVKFDVHLASQAHQPDHEHEHAHADGTRHSHSHSHNHGHEHGHGHEDHRPEHEHVHGRTFAEIKKLIAASNLSDWVQQKAVAVFHRVAVAEGKIHGHPPDEVHFHEVGAVDSIVDIVGACIGLELLGRPRVLAANPIEGTGTVKCAHGVFPIPAPATLEILSARGVAIQQCDEPSELITPTGAAILAEFVEEFGPMRNLAAEKIGYGLGTRENKTRVNVLRAVLGTTAATEKSATHETPGDASGNDWETDTIAVLETNLDDINAEILGHFVERALAAGALDVFHTPIQMKKNRPGVLLTVLCAGADAEKFSEIILRETSTFGLRRHLTERRKLKREFVKLKTAAGEVTIKIGRLNGRIVQCAPEFESCRNLAEQTKKPLKEIYAAAIQAMDGLT